MMEDPYQVLGLERGDILVIGCSSSEMVGLRIGKGSSLSLIHIYKRAGSNHRCYGNTDSHCGKDTGAKGGLCIGIEREPVRTS